MKYSYISSIGIANPVHKFSQEQAINYMLEGCNDRKEKLKVKKVFKTSGIDWRFSVMSDFSGSEPYTKPGAVSNLNVKDRMLHYKNNAFSLATKAINECLAKNESIKQNITHLITVSCTGMYAPGIDIEIIESLQLRKDIQRLSITFMGCQAAINAIKIADNICRSSDNAIVLIVCVELCTLHFQNKFDNDSILSNALFGDGAAAMLIHSKQPKMFSLIPHSFHSDILLTGKKDLTWNITSSGFQMELSSYIPELITSGINNFSENLLLNGKAKKEDINFYAIHPGGIKILKGIEKALMLSEEEMKLSYHVLRNFGNMSSPTILFILHSLLKENKDNVRNVLTLAFGPGLSIESVILKAA